jgi:hypothetical protein
MDQRGTSTSAVQEHLDKVSSDRSAASAAPWRHPARRAAASAQWRVSGTVRVLPDFLIIGAQKAGTTSVYDSLTEHPRVLPARKKEIRFFDRHWERGTNWYRWNFPTRWAMRAGNDRRLTGEATPDYLVDPRVPARVAGLVPGCKLIVLLRHPVDRALSQYQMNVALGVESRSFQEAIDGDLAELEVGDRECWGIQRGFRSYVERGRYAPQISRWMVEFPRDSLHIVTLEAMLSNRRDEMHRITSFLGLEVGDHPLDLAASNRRSYDPLGPAERRRLFSMFEDDVEQTSRLIDQDLPYHA